MIWRMSNDSIHIGNVVQSQVKKSGIKIAELARRINKSRRFIYVLFENRNAPLHYVEEIGNALHYDFSNEIAGINKTKEIEVCWKDKYISLLEEHNELLKQIFIKV
jgi:hypothetical protein